jgi:hypothetical protein
VEKIVLRKNHRSVQSTEAVVMAANQFNHLKSCWLQILTQCGAIEGASRIMFCNSLSTLRPSISGMSIEPRLTAEFISADASLHGAVQASTWPSTLRTGQPHPPIELFPFPSESDNIHHGHGSGNTQHARAIRSSHGAEGIWFPRSHLPQREVSRNKSLRFFPQTNNSNCDY